MTGGSHSRRSAWPSRHRTPERREPQERLDRREAKPPPDPAADGRIHSGRSEQQKAIVSLAAVRREEAACQRCELYRCATQVVPGEGAPGALLMLVGEQPGDREDLVGKPFVGPAGRILDRALGEAGIPRRAIFVTNAVKHFKYQWRGKRRLHKRPDAGEIEACRWWLDIERALVRPGVILALGATAARGVLGRAVTIDTARDRTETLADGTRVRITIHPSLLLRLPTEAERAAEYGRFVSDARKAAALAGLTATDA